MDEVDGRSTWRRLGPFGQFVIGFLVFAFVSSVAVVAFEHFLALTIRVPTVDQLPDQVVICNRTYQRAAGTADDLVTMGELRDAGIEPVIVLPLPMQPCDPDACWACRVEVFVRVVGDRYAVYDLQGGV